MNEPLTHEFENQLPDDLLRQAIESIESEMVPAGPPSELLAGTIGAIAALDEPEILRIDWRRRVFKFAAVAATLLVVVGLVSQLLPTAQAPSAAFGQEFRKALEQVRQPQAMSYTQELTIEGQPQPIVSKEYVAEDGRKRMELGFAATIFDTTGHVRLTLIDFPQDPRLKEMIKPPAPVTLPELPNIEMPKDEDLKGLSPEQLERMQKARDKLKALQEELAKKRDELERGQGAKRGEPGQPPAGLGPRRSVIVNEEHPNSGINAGKMFLSWLERLKDLGDRPDKMLGRKEIDGHKVTGFVVSEGDRSFEMWVDNTTGEPVRIEYDSALGDKATHIKMSDFHFHQKLDEKLFSFEVPAGYEIFGKPKDGKIQPPEGLEIAWTRKGRFAGVAAAPDRASVFALEYGGRLSQWNADSDEIARANLDKEAGKIRTAKLLAGEGCQLLRFGHPGLPLAAYSPDGTLLWTYPEQKPQGMGINDVCPVDLDGDGLDEVVIGFSGFTGVHALTPQGKLLWKNTERGNVWHVAAGNVDSDPQPRVLTTDADGKVHILGAEGKQLRVIDPGIYAQLVRIWQPGGIELSASNQTREASPRIIVGGGGDDAKLLLLNYLGETEWSLQIPAQVKIAAISSDPGWLAVSLLDGNLLVVDLATGKQIASVGGQTPMAEVAWLDADPYPPLLVVANNGKLQAFRVTGKKP